VTRAEELISSTTRAIASAVRDVPPLRLETVPDELRSASRGRPRRPRGHSRLRRLRPWITPLAAAVSVVAVALALVLIKSFPNGSAAPPAANANSAAVKDVPRYYVAWMQSSSSYLVVGDTVSGKRVATVMPPSGIFFDTVFGEAADDRTFVVTGEHHKGGTLWYLLRITPGASVPARLIPLPLPVPARQSPAAAAISPDGTRLAVALTGTPAALRIYSVPAGKLLRSWTAASGQITATPPQPGSWPFAELALRWSADGRHLAFAWNAAAIRVLDATAPGGSLLANSSELAAIGTLYRPGSGNLTCDATHGWSLLAGGSGIVCAVRMRTSSAQSAPVAGLSGVPSGGGACSGAQRFGYGFVREIVSAQGSGHTPQLLGSVADCGGQGAPASGAYIGWASADGSTMIGSLVWDGNSRFGVFRDGRFTPLPPLPVSMPVGAGVLIGADAW
jgi:hypothetical protein